MGEEDRNELQYEPVEGAREGQMAHKKSTWKYTISILMQVMDARKLCICAISHA
jgi:hypothetical protein